MLAYGDIQTAVFTNDRKYSAAGTMATMLATTTIGATQQPGVAPASLERYLERDADLRTLDELIKLRARELGSAPLIGCPNTGLVDFEQHSASAIDKYADATVVELIKLNLQPVVS